MFGIRLDTVYSADCGDSFLEPGLKAASATPSEPADPSEPIAIYRLTHRL
jgi:hypothetical protein